MAMLANPDNLRLLLHLGLFYLKLRHNFALAVELFERAITLYPEDADAHALYGESVSVCVGNYELARKEFTRALELDPANVVAALGLATVSWAVQKNPQEARQHL